MIAVFVFGLGGIIGLMAVMKYVFDQRENLGLIISFTLLSFLIMLAVEGVLIAMLLGRKRDVKKAEDSERLEEQAAKEPADASRVLPRPAVSVTEHTTRTLEPAASQRKTE
jgi:Na+-transporting methylmalonyl-CoA/oxaloacetate decarboxylase gamma subunit